MNEAPRPGIAGTGWILPDEQPTGAIGRRALTFAAIGTLWLFGLATAFVTTGGDCFETDDVCAEGHRLQILGLRTILIMIVALTVLGLIAAATDGRLFYALLVAGSTLGLVLAILPFAAISLRAPVNVPPEIPGGLFFTSPGTVTVLAAALFGLRWQRQDAP